MTLDSKIAIMEDDKENYIPSTPKKMGVSSTFKTTLGLPSPLSPSKRGINQNAPESPTKRLQTGRLSVDIPPPRMELPVAGRVRR